jgi:3-hydroxyisobutyrate dehydrogenase-like beta-hydroxyacid dehydrogenase
MEEFEMRSRTIGFIGVGRLGLPLARLLLGAGFVVATTKRGRSEDLISAGGHIPGDGSPLAVAEVSDAVITCMPSVDAFEEVLDGPDGILRAGSVPPVIDTSTMPLAVKLLARDKLLACQSGLLDAPVSGTPAMVERKMAMIYASGEHDLYLRHESVLRAMSGHATYVGRLLEGSKYKFVAQFLATIHATAAVHAMVYAQRAGLDLDQVSTLISASPGATSGQFQVRAPLIAAGQFEAKLVTVDIMLKDVDEVLAYGRQIGAPTELLEIVAQQYHRLSESGQGDAEPAALFPALVDAAGAIVPDHSGYSPATDAVT